MLCKNIPTDSWDLGHRHLWRGFPGGTSGKEPTCQCGRHKRLGFDPWVRKIPWRRAWPPTPVFLPGESHRQRSLAGCSPWSRKEWDTTERLNTHAHIPHTKYRVQKKKKPSLKCWPLECLSEPKLVSVRVPQRKRTNSIHRRLERDWL